MAEPLRPAAAKLYTRENWIYVPTIASPTLAPTTAEGTAASALDITNIAFVGGQPNPTQTTNSVEQTRRFGDARVFKFVGAQTFDGGEVRCQFDDQAAALADAVKAWEKFSAGGVTGYFVNRRNVPKATDLIAGQFVHVYPVECGPALPVPEGEGEAAEGAMAFQFEITAPPALKIAILA